MRLLFGPILKSIQQNFFSRWNLLLLLFCAIWFQMKRTRLSPGVNFTNILRAAFAPKSFCQKITNPNWKLIKAAQRTLVWLSILLIFYEQLFHTKVLWAAFISFQFRFVIFWRKDFGAKAALKMLVKLTPVQHWFIKAQVNQCIQGESGLMPHKLKWN